MLDLLDGLLGKSLMVVDEGSVGDRRYRMLETIRQFGRERLVREGEAA